MKLSLDKTKLFLVIFMLLLCNSISSKEFYFSHINASDGLLQSSAVSIFQDKQGRMWFGNDNLNLYTGNTKKVFRLSTFLKDVEDSNIHMICGDGHDLLYMLADTRIVSYNLRFEKFTDLNIEADVITFQNGSLLYAKGNKLYGYDINKGISNIYTFKDSLTSIRSIINYDSSYILGTNNGVFAVSNRQSNCLVDKLNVSCIFIDSQKILWIGTVTEGVVRLNLDTKEITVYQMNNPDFPLINNQIRCINEDNLKNIWVGTYLGITVISPSNQPVTHLTYKENVPWSLGYSSVYAIYRDIQGGMWVGTYYGGVSYCNPDVDRFTFYTSNRDGASDLNGFLFGKMTEDMQGNVYIATEKGGLNMLDLKTRMVYRFENGTTRFPFNTAKAVWYDREYDRIFIGAFLGGVLIYSPKGGGFKTISNDVLTENSQKIVVDFIPWRENLIILTQKGIYLLDRKTLKIAPMFSTPEIIKKTKGIIRAIYLDSRDNLWIDSSSEGVFYVGLTNEKLHIPNKLNRIIGKHAVNSIVENSIGEIFFATNGLGVIEYNPMDFNIRCFNEQSGSLLSDDCFKALVLRSGKLLITSTGAITILDPANGSSSHTLLKRSYPVNMLNVDCGLFISAFNDEILIGGIKGLISVKEDGLYSKAKTYKLWFSGLTVNNQEAYPSTHAKLLKESITLTKQLTLPHNQNNLGFVFSSSDYLQNNKGLYEYKLEGLDNQWTKTSNKEIIYTALPPGDYNLIVRETEVNGKQISMKIKILPPFYASIYAWIIYGALLLLFIIWVIRFNRSRAVLKASLEMEHREKLHMEELNKMKLAFFTNISHELRTPLTLIISQMEMIVGNHVFSSLVRKRLNKIYNHALHMQELITELLDFRKQEQEGMKLHVCSGNFVVFLENQFQNFSEYAAIRHITFVYDTSVSNIELWFDPMQMQKVINNLLSNAFKFTPAGGRITLSLLARESFVEVSVADTGYGISKDQLERIFYRFYQVEESSDVSPIGSGIGLALTKEIILQHKGDIQVTSEKGEGTTFTIRLLTGNAHFTSEQMAVASFLPTRFQPVIKTSDDLAVDDQNSDEENVMQPDKAYSILFVDDNEELLDILEEAFSHIYKIHKAYNGLEGLKIAQEMMPDLIICDVMMPLMSGHELCSRLKNDIGTSHIPVILLTAQADTEQILKGLKSEADDYLTKPFNIELLLLKCNNLMKHRRELQARFSSLELPDSTVDLATNRMDQILLDKSILLIENNLINENFTIDSWCKEIGVSRTKLANKIKAITGYTLNDFILQIKLNKSASLLLIQKELNIAEVAFQTGFSSAGYFGKCFKKRFGITPGEYRINKQENHQDS